MGARTLDEGMVLAAVGNGSSAETAILTPERHLDLVPRWPAEKCPAYEGYSRMAFEHYIQNVDQPALSRTIKPRNPKKSRHTDS